MSDILSADFLQDQESQKLYQQEKLILDVTEIIAGLMEKGNISRVELARRIDRHKTYVTRLLDGTANMTLRTVSDVLFALDSKLLVDAVPLKAKAVLKTKVNVISPDMSEFVESERDNWKVTSFPENFANAKPKDEYLGAA